VNVNHHALSPDELSVAPPFHAVGAAMNARAPVAAFTSA
jgi:hypothetical protein